MIWHRDLSTTRAIGHVGYARIVLALHQPRKTLKVAVLHIRDYDLLPRLSVDDGIMERAMRIDVAKRFLDVILLFVEEGLSDPFSRRIWLLHRRELFESFGCNSTTPHLRQRKFIRPLLDETIGINHIMITLELVWSLLVLDYRPFWPILPRKFIAKRFVLKTGVVDGTWS
eukprot:CAMPEP_0181344422 /NCGR_PEP_ID=MMETSP1101-20121128/32164_1 /TAXON_ID=46948 /ORGANISM="Rhodomonas abbreviata, Strain Caron Lab Isolate" /LENGTH=170 /DNA_ID=CAMNT_0023456223 /DNA_START=532 /DNA_END=1044 /DNA_ORIENTATION=-